MIRRLLARKGKFVPSIRSDARIRDVVGQLELDDAGALVVTDDGRRILGIISERDIVRALQHCDDPAAVMDQPVQTLMHREVYSCDISEPMAAVYQLMDRCQIRHVPVTEKGELRGIITMLDVVKYQLAETRDEAEYLKEYVARQV